MTAKGKGIKGHGTNVKRLWIRTTRGTWMPIPYGADNDMIHGAVTKVRSFNVWDGDQWLMPIGREVAVEIPSRSLNINTPGRIWSDTEYNPNYINHVPPHPAPHGWIQLTEMQPRNDSTWRITALPPNVPLRPPSIPERAPGSASALSPDMYVPTVVFDGTIADLGSFGYDYRYPLPSSPVIGGGSGPYVTSNVQVSQIGTSGLEEHQEQRRAVNLDLKAMKNWLFNVYPESDYYVGVYENIAKMTLKRVIIYGTFAIDMAAYGVPVLFRPNIEAAFDQCTFTVYMKGNAGGVVVDSTYGVWTIWGQRRPAVTVIDGDPLLTQLGLPGPTTYPNDVASRSYTRSFCLIVEGPIEETVRFSAQITDPPSAAAHVNNQIFYPEQWVSRIQVTADRTEFHYAVAGADTDYNATEYGLGDGT